MGLSNKLSLVVTLDSFTNNNFTDFFFLQRFFSLSFVDLPLNVGCSSISFCFSFTSIICHTNVTPDNFSHFFLLIRLLYHCPANDAFPFLFYLRTLTLISTRDGNDFLFICFKHQFDCLIISYI